ncbi:MAG TPA: YjjG family noncanonical pyrimidine nucleotidase [Chitinophagales bacterium]|nr:YjjG family noncanonical pyrimidine nucleotidase [Chitinophagales bacterium]
MSKYKHIFFDFDHTLWDFETNSTLALQQIFSENALAERGIASFEKFHYKYQPINDRYWARYHHGIVDKEQVRVGRFYDTLKEFGIDDSQLAEKMAEAYITISPKMTALFPDAIEVLQYLQQKYTMHLITNGFAEVQWIKIENSGLKPFFEHIIISEEVGTQKPDKAIFELAMQRAGTTVDACIMVGDNYNTDIVGAKNAGIDQVFFNPKKNRRREPPTYEIVALSELKGIL